MLALSNYRRKLFDLQTFQNQAHIISVTGIIIYFLGTYYLHTKFQEVNSFKEPACASVALTEAPLTAGVYRTAKHALVPLVVVVVVVLVPPAPADLVHRVHHVHPPLELLQHVRR